MSEGGTTRVERPELSDAAASGRRVVAADAHDPLTPLAMHLWRAYVYRLHDASRYARPLRSAYDLHTSLKTKRASPYGLALTWYFDVGLTGFEPATS
jgi:hypothetical protein